MVIPCNERLWHGVVMYWLGKLLFEILLFSGELQWVVTEKVSRYGQSLTLFCPVDNCCNKYAGWSKESKTIIIDVKIYPDDPNLKYGGTYNKSGFGLIIRNLSETDLNKTYQCVYGVQLSTRQYLLQEDVFKKGNQLSRKTCLNRTPFRTTFLFGIDRCLQCRLHKLKFRNIFRDRSGYTGFSM